jgi:4-carboxymuconolactone decarboxylase
VHAVAYGKPLGLTEDQLTATVHGSADDPSWTPHDAALVRLADQLHHTSDVTDELWANLAQRFRHDQLIELIIIAGWYRLLSGVINAARVQPEPWARRFPR